MADDMQRRSGIGGFCSSNLFHILYESFFHAIHFIFGFFAIFFCAMMVLGYAGCDIGILSARLAYYWAGYSFCYSPVLVA